MGHGSWADGGDVVDRLREQLADHPEVVVAYLFGSRARGGERPDSDTDVAVLLADDDDDSRRVELAVSASLSQVVAPSRLDLVVLNHAPVALAYRAVRDGVVLVSRDDLTRVRHWVTTVDRYLDMAPARALLAAGVANRLAEGRFGRR